jgi:hypothetical protein
VVCAGLLSDKRRATLYKPMHIIGKQAHYNPSIYLKSEA